MEAKHQFVGIENAAKLPGADYTHQMQIRAMTMPRKKRKDQSPLFKVLAKLGFGQDPISTNREREDKST